MTPTSILSSTRRHIITDPQNHLAHWELNPSFAYSILERPEGSCGISSPSVTDSKQQGSKKRKKKFLPRFGINTLKEQHAHTQSCFLWNSIMTGGLDVCMSVLNLPLQAIIFFWTKHSFITHHTHSPSYPTPADKVDLCWTFGLLHNTAVGCFISRTTCYIKKTSWTESPFCSLLVSNNTFGIFFCNPQSSVMCIQYDANSEWMKKTPAFFRHIYQMICTSGELTFLFVNWENHSSLFSCSASPTWVCMGCFSLFRYTTGPKRVTWR